MSPKYCTCDKKLRFIFWKRGRSTANVTQKVLRLVCKDKRLSQSATLATQNHMTTCSDTFEKEMFFQPPLIDTAKPQDNQTPEMRHVGVSKRTFRASLRSILTLCSFKIDGILRILFRPSKFSTSKLFFCTCTRIPSIFHHIHKCYACRGIWTFSPFHVVLTMWLGEKSQHTRRLKWCSCHAR